MGLPPDHHFRHTMSSDATTGKKRGRWARNSSVLVFDATTSTQGVRRPLLFGRSGVTTDRKPLAREGMTYLPACGAWDKQYGRLTDRWHINPRTDTRGRHGRQASATKKAYPPLADTALAAGPTRPCPVGASDGGPKRAARPSSAARRSDKGRRGPGGVGNSRSRIAQGERALGRNAGLILPEEVIYARTL